MYLLIILVPGGGRTPTGRSPADFEFPMNTVSL